MVFSDYRPENFDLAFCGVVTARDALVRSLNIPALTAVQSVGVADFVSALLGMGLRTVDGSPSHYGIGIVLGGCEVTLLDLAGAYACLARGGEYLPVRTRPDPPRGMPRRVFSREAAWLVTDALGGDERAGQLTGHTAQARLPRMAWKTGTSAGRRDAWTVGYNPRYVVAVWLGNPDGSAAPGITGGEAAAPLAFDVLRALDPRGDGPWFEAPPGIETRSLCAVSGMRPGDACPSQTAGSCIRGVTSQDRCSIHRVLPFDRATGRRLTPADAAGGDVAWKPAEVWPEAVESFLRGRVGPGATVAGAGGATPASGKLVITSPLPGGSYRLLEPTPGMDQSLALSAGTDAAAGRLYWFVNGELLASCRPEQPVLWPLRRGAHTVSCCDDRGRAAACRVRVD